MFSHDRLARTVTAAVGALFLSTLSIVAATGPVQASAPESGWIGWAEFRAPTRG